MKSRNVVPSPIIATTPAAIGMRRA